MKAGGNRGMEEKKLPAEVLENISSKLGIQVDSEEFAMEMDARDELARFKEKFVFPDIEFFKEKGNIVDNGDANSEIIYLCGHSLGLKPKRSDELVHKVLQNWGQRAVKSHFEGFLPASECEDYSKDIMAELVGAEKNDITVMNGLTVNLQLLMTAFYKPTQQRHKILIEHLAFPSDRYAVQSQLALHGYDPDTSLIIQEPRQNENCIRTEDILKTIEERGSEIDLILWPGVQYYTGQKFNLEPIVKAAKAKGCKIGLDLAHSVGNVILKLDEWGPDFAAWCTYKYLCSGPGGVSGVFINRIHTQDSGSSYLKGWWGNESTTRFDMRHNFEPSIGANRFKLSNEPPVLIAMLMSSLEIYHEATMPKLVAKQFLLTGFLEYLLKKRFPNLEFLTPSDTEQRGSQLSFLIKGNISGLQNKLENKGVICDVRQPSAVRIAPVPTYTSFKSVFKFIQILSSLSEEFNIN